jgi:hypothetical protein
MIGELWAIRIRSAGTCLLPRAGHDGRQDDVGPALRLIGSETSHCAQLLQCKHFILDSGGVLLMVILLMLSTRCDPPRTRSQVYRNITIHADTLLKGAFIIDSRAACPLVTVWYRTWPSPTSLSQQETPDAVPSKATGHGADYARPVM